MQIMMHDIEKILLRIYSGGAEEIAAVEFLNGFEWDGIGGIGAN